MADNSVLVFTPSARRAQQERGSAKAYERKTALGFPDRVTPQLTEFLTGIDTAFLGTVSAAGAPYIQHRGGPKGFIKVVDERTLGFADYRGNRQYITLGNLAENPKAHLFLIEYLHRQRVKIWGEARVVEGDDELTAKLMPKGYKARPEQAILFTVSAWDANCPQHIPQRFDAADVEAALVKRDQRIAALEAEIERLRQAVAGPP